LGAGKRLQGGPSAENHDSKVKFEAGHTHGYYPNVTKNPTIYSQNPAIAAREGEIFMVMNQFF
jgi:hypothetical protein